MFNCVFVSFPGGILVQVCYLIVFIPDICRRFILCPNDGIINSLHVTIKVLLKGAVAFSGLPIPVSVYWIYIPSMEPLSL